MLETYASEVASLPSQHFVVLMQSLEFGLQHSDPLVVQVSGWVANSSLAILFNLLNSLRF